MQAVFGILYTLLFFYCVAAAVFIVFHLICYSLDRRTALFGSALFIAVVTVLLFTNAMLFFSLPLSALVPDFSSF